MSATLMIKTPRITLLFSILLLFPGCALAAAQCSKFIFPDALATHASSSNAIIALANNAQVKDSGNLLETLAISGGSSNCDGQPCTASGRAAADFDWPFQQSHSDVDIPLFGGFVSSIGVNRINRFRHVFTRCPSQGDCPDVPVSFPTGVFSEFFLEQLSIRNNESVTFNAGQTYYIGRLNLANNATIYINGNGTAKVIIRDGLTIPNNMRINSPGANQGGDASRLLLYAHNEVTLGKNVTFSGVLYSKGKVSIGNNSHFFGAATGKSISLSNNATVSYSQNIANADLVQSCDIAHYQFEETNWQPGHAIIDDVGGNNAAALNGANIVFPNPQVSCQVLGIPQNTSISSKQALDTGIDINRLGNDGTISFWYRSNQAWNSGTARQLFDASTTVNNRYFYLALTSNGSLELGMEDSNDRRFLGTSQNYTFNAGDWVHIAVSWNLPSRTMQMFLNGVQVPVTMNNEALSTALADFDTLYIGDNRSSYFAGNGSSGNSANGMFDDVRIYEFVQTKDEVVGDMNTLSPCSKVHHYLLEHDGIGLTCEAERMTLKACANDDCSDLYTGISSMTMGGTGWSAASNSFTGATSLSLTHTTADPVTATIQSAYPIAPLRCSNGACDIEFKDAAFEFIDTDSGAAPLPAVIAETPLDNVALRATYNAQGVCKPLLQGTQNIQIAYDCIAEPDYSSNICQRSFAGIGLSGQQSGAVSGSVHLAFNVDGIANFAGYSYADAGRLQLSATAVIDGVTITSGQANLDVVPDRLALSSDCTSPSKCLAGVDFTYSVVAKGANGAQLPGYSSGHMQMSVARVIPNASEAREGDFIYARGKKVTSTFSPDNSPGFSNTDLVDFNQGKYRFTQAYYAEVGSIDLRIRDNDYLGATINANTLTLGDFIPAYFDVESTPPRLENSCADTYTYIGDDFGYESGLEPTFTLTALNGLGHVTNNYGGSLWKLTPSVSDITYADNSIKGYVGSITQAKVSGRVEVSAHEDYDGKGIITVLDSTFAYSKTHSVNVAHPPAAPFDASLTMILFGRFFNRCRWSLL